MNGFNPEKVAWFMAFGDRTKEQNEPEKVFQFCAPYAIYVRVSNQLGFWEY